MTNFVFNPVVNAPPPDITSAALGTGPAGLFAQADVGKPVKLGTANNYLLCAAGDEIAGFVFSLEAATVNNGFSFGAVQKNKRFVAKIDAAQLGTLVVGGLVAAGTQAILGTAQTEPVVQGLTPVATTVHKWQIIRIISGTGVAGDLILIERV